MPIGRRKLARKFGAVKAQNSLCDRAVWAADAAGAAGSFLVRYGAVFSGHERQRTMGRTPRWRRRSGPSQVGEVLPTARWRRQPAWRRVVGRALAELTVPVDVDESGVLRVMAVNETARREVEARADHVIAAWNAVSAPVRGYAERLSCWVRPGLAATDIGSGRRAVAGGGAAAGSRGTSGARRPLVSTDVRELAERRAGEVRDDAVRAALADAMARWLASGASAGHGDASDSAAGDGT